MNRKNSTNSTKRHNASDTPLVSIVCTTYNHASYIADALEGFVSQEVNFGIECLVHDDASNDGTTEIVREYASRYPDLIFPLIQEKNQYSQGVRIFDKFIRPLIRGKYIARCEGDDFWTNPLKLQQQIDWLEAHPECSACVHSTILMEGDRKSLIRAQEGDGALAFRKVVGHNAGFHTSSIVHRTDVLGENQEFLRAAPGIGDYPLRVLLALSGQIHYIDEPMSVYRFMVPGSWSVRRSAPEARAEDRLNLIKMLIMADEYSSGKYHCELTDARLEMECALLDSQGKHREILREPYRDVFKRIYSPRAKARILLAATAPSLGKRLAR